MPEGKARKGTEAVGSRRNADTTLYVVCYDVTDDRRRAKVHAILSGFGAWKQYSLFECYLTRQEVVLMRSRLTEMINLREDTIRLYALCGACRERVDVLGCGDRPQEPKAYIV